MIDRTKKCYLLLPNSIVLVCFACVYSNVKKLDVKGFVKLPTLAFSFKVNLTMPIKVSFLNM